MSVHSLPSTDVEHANDPLWAAICAEVRDVINEEPMLEDFLTATILDQTSLESALSAHLGNQIDCATVPARVLCNVISEAFATRNDIRQAMRDDLQAVVERDSACEALHLPLLYFKGFQALQLHRVANWLWNQNRQSLALLMQSRASMKFSVDIHPAAKFGHGIMLDHATGLVVGETAVVGNQVSILQSVTLGGTGKEHGDRHPKIRDGVLISAGAKILGNITVGEGAKVGAGSVVLRDVPAHTTVAGVPAKIVGKPDSDRPALSMNHEIPDYEW
ncbi:MAG: serine O-acetyltransferase [Luminiphilus sp.]|jgi:serine O-acetyltransferase|nr:serine O-acetyltransferase [Pseudomonadales bacterium]MBL6901557.1 serine O-acetyltransferase [Luminiphilus sp.]